MLAYFTTIINDFLLNFFFFFSAKSIARDLEERDAGRQIRKKPGASSRRAKTTGEHPPNNNTLKLTETSSPSTPGKSSDPGSKAVVKSDGKRDSKLSIEDAIDDINEMEIENDTPDYEVSNSFGFHQISMYKY